MDISTINSDLIRGNVTTVILKALYDGTSYGYDILKLIEEKTNGKYVIKQPTLYSCLKRLEKQNLITSYMGNVDDTSGARRRYYSLTESGLEYLQRQQAEYEFSRTILDKLLSDKVFDLSLETTPFDINELRPYTKVAQADADDDENVKVVEKVVEKPVYIEKPVEKIVYVDRPVETVVEKPIYVDRPVEVEKVVYVDRYVEKQPSQPAQQPNQQNYNRQPSGIILNNMPKQDAYREEPKYEEPQQERYTQPVYSNQPQQPRGIIVNEMKRQQESQQQNGGKLPQAPLINRMQESLRTNENLKPSEQNRQAQVFRPANYVAPETPVMSHTEAQDRATQILGIGKYRQTKTINPNGDDDSPSGTRR